MAELSQETKTIATIMRHTRIIQFLLRSLAANLERRSDLHDLSKWSLDELEGFVEINYILRNYEFGSQEYKDSLKDNKAIDLHFSRNRHHPEYHPNGVSDMSLIDFIELVVDWRAANMSYGDISWKKSVDIQIDRFKLAPEQIYLVKMISDTIEGIDL